MYGFLASLINEPVNSEFVHRLEETEAVSLLATVQTESLLPDIGQGLDKISRFIQAAVSQPDENVERSLAVDWTRLFRGVSPEYGPSPPYEALYIDEKAENSETIQAVYKYYKENGVNVGSASPNRADYLGIELDFLRHLSEREADAIDAGDADKAATHHETAKRFLSEHPGKWCGKFCDAAVNYAKTEFYLGVLLLTKGVINREVSRIGYK